MNSIHFSPFFKAFLLLLNSEEVEYLVVGGYAVRYHGYPRSTRDLDIWIGTRRENAEKIYAIMRLWADEIPEFLPELFEHPNRIVRLSLPSIKVEIVDPIMGQKARVLDQYSVEMPGQVEILTVQTGVEFYDCFTRRLADQIDGVEVNMVSLQDLKKIKHAGDRPKDRQDLAYLP